MAASAGGEFQRVGGVAASAAARLRHTAATLALLPRVRQQVPRRIRQVLHRMRGQKTHGVNQTLCVRYLVYKVVWT